MSSSFFSHLFGWLKKNRDQDSCSSDAGHIQTGKTGELRAIRWLEQHQFRIISRNYWTKYGEIDIIAEKRGMLHFVEVKTLRIVKDQDARINLTPRKMQCMIRSVCDYLKKHPEWKRDASSVDAIIVCLEPDTIQYYEKIIADLPLSYLPPGI